MQVRLAAKSKKGRDRIARNGDTATVLKSEDVVHWTYRLGPWLLIAGARELFWVHADCDEHLHLEEVGAPERRAHGS